MTRFAMPLALFALAGVVLCAPAGADDPPKKDEPLKKLTPAERKELVAKADDLNDAGLEFYRTGKRAEAEKAFADALAITRRLYPKADYPDGHENLATNLQNLGSILQVQEKLADAEPLIRESLGMRKRLIKGDSQNLVVSLNNLAMLLEAQGKLTDAEPLLRDALAMSKRLHRGDHSLVLAGLNNLGTVIEAQGQLAEAEPFLRDALGMSLRLHKGDHFDVARSQNNLGMLLRGQRKWADAEPLLRDSLAMRKRLFKGDHPAVAVGLNNLGGWYFDQRKWEDAEPLYRDVLAMRKRLHAGDHPEVAEAANNLATVLQPQGETDEAERLFNDSLAMRKRLYKGDHPMVAQSFHNLARQFADAGRWAEAERLFRDSLAMWGRLLPGDQREVAWNTYYLADVLARRGDRADADPLYRAAATMFRRLIASYAEQKSEGEALALLASFPRAADGFLSNARELGADVAKVYPEVWASRAAVGRVHEGRQRAARAASADPKAAGLVADLADARRRRAELLLAPAVRDPGTQKKREADIAALDRRIAERDAELRPLLPLIERSENLAASVPPDLQKVLPADAVFVDFLRYTRFTQDKDKPGVAGERWTPYYLAFVVTRTGVEWFGLGPADAIETAVTGWRDAITAGKDIPAAVPAKVRELVWAKVRAAVPAGTKTVYIAPDLALCRVPWAALPGDRPDTILLDEFAVATVPHGAALLDALRPGPRKNPPTGALVVGGVKYDAVAPVPKAPAGPELPIKPGAKFAWPFLAGADAEAGGVARAAARQKLATTRIAGTDATSAAVLAALPKAKHAHFATHGFFADPSFQSAFRLDPKDFETRGVERVGRAAMSPLVMTGLVFAGANDPNTPGRGVVTGEALVNLDLSGLELAVLSACETGVGDVAGGEGTFGLQRAFHYAGTTNVVASLWKVPDAPTAALMGAFYRNLWDKGLTPMEALRQAQLEVYRNPQAIPELAKGFRGVFEEVDAPKIEVKTANSKAHPLLWAAFTLSGPGR